MVRIPKGLSGSAKPTIDKQRGIALGSSVGKTFHSILRSRLTAKLEFVATLRNRRH